MRDAPPTIVLDFETHSIERRPEYPPKPTSFSIQFPSEETKFLSWGHPFENNCSFEDAKRYVKEAWSSEYPILFHNAKFDLDVAETHFGMHPLPWHRIHDTMLLLFLNSPHSETLSLKPAAVKHLGYNRDAQDELHIWILDHVLTTEAGGDGQVLISPTVIDKKPPNTFRVTKSKAAKFIAYAPGALVGKYADTDVAMTRDLFDLMHPLVMEAGMSEPYDRERKLINILLKNERQGVRVNHKLIKRDLNRGRKDLVRVDEYVVKMLDAPGLEINKPEDFADALEAAGMIGEWVITDKGKRSVSKDNLASAIKDPTITNILAYRAKLNNTLNNFIIPWDRMAKANDGFINCSWNQVRSTGDGDSGRGAATGRISSTPNFQTATNEPVKLVSAGDGLVLPEDLLKTLKQLPKVRGYVIPDTPGSAIVGVDWASQELRLLAHYEDTTMLAAYVADPELDFHNMAVVKLSELLGIEVTRKQVKGLSFCIIYGGGLALLAKMIGVDLDSATQFRDAYYKMIPGLKPLESKLKRIGKQGEYLTTLGGRRYFVEPPKFVEGVRRTFEYRMMNKLIQASAADCMKQALINYDEACHPSARLLLSIHDEILSSRGDGDYRAEAKLLGDVMTQTGLEMGCDVSMPTDAEWSDKSWADMSPLIK